VAINRFAAGVDPDHFSSEGSGVVVRGLNFVRSELNGRDTFSANNGRALSFADVPSELMGGVDVFKSPSADMIEGGISGTVNLRTRLPFDSTKRLLSLSAESQLRRLRQALGADLFGALQRPVGHRGRHVRPAAERRQFQPLYARRRHPGLELRLPHQLQRQPDRQSASRRLPAGRQGRVVPARRGLPQHLDRA
jgi:outer membrane receptor protein involved in Fe transport